MLCRRLLIVCLLCVTFALGCKRQSSYVEVLPTTRQYMEAQELKLKVRELADQLLATMPNDCLTGLVALPTAFVNLDNFQQSSAFGRLVGESMIYEFNQRSFPVREYRLPGYIAMRAEQGDFALARQGLVNAQEKWAALLIGTYYRDKDAVFVNARLVRAADGMVLRTAQLVLANSELVARLTTPTPTPEQVRAKALAEATAQATAQANAQMAMNTATSRGVMVSRPSAQLTTGTLTIQQAPISRTKRAPKGPGLYGQGVQQ